MEDGDATFFQRVFLNDFPIVGNLTKTNNFLKGIGMGLDFLSKSLPESVQNCNSNNSIVRLP